MTTRWRPFALALTAVLLTPFAGFAADSLKWDTAGDTVEATVETWTVPQMLQHVATATRWQIFIDPGITNRIPAKFSGKQPGEALRRLLGHYNYALVPETNAPSKLFVFRNSRDQATRAIQPAGQITRKPKHSLIGNELVVTLKPGEKIEDLAGRPPLAHAQGSAGRQVYCRGIDRHGRAAERRELRGFSAAGRIRERQRVFGRSFARDHDGGSDLACQRQLRSSGHNPTPRGCR